jgi:hypothetical protein
MSIQDRDEAADREFANDSVGQKLPDSTEAINLPAKNAAIADERDRTTKATLKDISKNLKDNPAPSFQEMDTPAPTLTDNSTKIEELKSISVAIAEQLIDRGEDTADRKPSVSQS